MAGGGKIYRESQVQLGILLASMLQGPRDQVFDWDDMFYNANPSGKYETEGTYAQQPSNGAVISFASGAVAGNRARLNVGLNNTDLLGTLDYDFTLRGIASSAVNNDLFIGAFSGLPTAASPPVEPANGVYFRLKGVAGTEHYFAVARAGGVETAVDTGLQRTSGDFVDFRIEHADGRLRYFMDGVLVATITTNIPTVNLFTGFVTVTREAVAKTIFADTRVVWARRL